MSLAVVGCGGAAEHPAPAAPAAAQLVGPWRAVLASPGGELPFGLVVREGAEGLSAVVVNGEEEAPFSGVRREEDGEVVFEFDWYDSRIRARFDEGGDWLTGEWTKTAPEGISRLPFAAQRATEAAGSERSERFRPLEEVGLVPVADASTTVAGEWAMEFVDDSGSEPAQGVFRQDGTRVTGTILTPVGDYRYLAGSYESGVLRLSTFDGAHAFLFQARAEPDGALAGDFWSRDSYHATWTARPAAGAADADSLAGTLPDGWQMVGLTNDEGAFRFRFPDLEGREVALSDPQFDGRVVLVNIFGSWCPNCNDEAPLLAAWDRQYREQGLSIVGLAYEFTGDVERDRRVLRRFAARYGITYSLLLAGTSDKQAAGRTLPDLSAVLAYPTSVFVGRDGKVRRIYTGFSGPGTGEHHQQLKAEMTALIEELLAEPAPASSG
jgi:thiol-disulfide isomerase/thioredoxin